MVYSIDSAYNIPIDTRIIVLYTIKFYSWVVNANKIQLKNTKKMY